MDIINEFVNRMPAKRKRTTSGWVKLNGPCCTHFGHRADRKMRGGYKVTGDAFSFHCFNCSFKTSWQAGRSLSQSAKKLLEYLGATPTDIKKISFHCLKQKNDAAIVNGAQLTENKKIFLPEGSKSFVEWIDDSPDDFIKILDYINDRNVNLINWHEYYWTPNTKDGMNKRVIVPFTSEDGWILGYSARSIDDKVVPKYLMQVANSAYLFNQDKLYSSNRKFVIVCEGIFDAVSLDCVAVMKQYLTDGQIKTLSTTDKKIIIVPDRDAAGKQLVEQAIKHEYSVSFPDWDDGIKDIADAVAKYGRLAALQQILESTLDSELKIKLKMRGWFNG